MSTQNTKSDDSAISSGCPHFTAHQVEGAGRVCSHLLYPTEDHLDYYKRFTGIGSKYDLLCEQHAYIGSQDSTEDDLLIACRQCIVEIEKRDSWEGLQGQPQVGVRTTSLYFVHQEIQLRALASSRMLALAPAVLPDLAQPSFLGVDEKGRLLRLDFTERHVTTLAKLPDDSVDLEQPISLYASPDGRAAVVVNTRGQFGCVVELQSGKVTMKLQRDTYHIEYCIFPIAFFEHRGALRLAHATTWNRLDVSDPLTGELLTPRDFVWPEPSPQNPYARPEHYLDYFHCSLLVSPDGERVVDSGWVWHPIGIVRAWSLRDWLDGNVWESEDGPSVRNFAQKEYYWDGPACWVENRTVAIWGYGGDDEWQIPAAWLFDVRTGQEVGWFPGPEGNFAFDPVHNYLLSYAEEKGTAVWELSSGERLLFDASLRPSVYHTGASCFLTNRGDGVFILSHLE